MSVKMNVNDYGLTNNVIVTNCPMRIASTLNIIIGVSDYHNQYKQQLRCMYHKVKKE